MVAISKQLEQVAVRRWYYAGDYCPSAAEYIAMARKLDGTQGFEPVDVSRGPGVDKVGVPCMCYVALFQRDGGTLEAKAAHEADRLMELAAEEDGVKLNWGTPSGDRRDK